MSFIVSLLHSDLPILVHLQLQLRVPETDAEKNDFDAIPAVRSGVGVGQDFLRFKEESVP